MKRSFLQTSIVLSTILLVTGPSSFGDSKNRIGFGGSQRGQAGNQNSQTSSQSGSLAGRLGSLNSGNSTRHGGSGNGQHSNNQTQTMLPGRLGHVVKPGHNVMLPGNLQHGNLQHGNLQNGNRHAILLPNGNRTKSVPFDVAQFLRHKSPSGQAQPQIQQIMATAPKHLCSHPHFSWWVNVCQDHCHAHYGCWNTSDHYWDCWTPCSWNVVQCQQFTYYVGLSCLHVPDMQAYAVQSVVNGSPAHLAGLQPGDLILAVNGQSILVADLINTELSKGRLDLQVIRQGSPAPLLLSVFPRLVQTVSF